MCVCVLTLVANPASCICEFMVHRKFRETLANFPEYFSVPTPLVCVLAPKRPPCPEDTSHFLTPGPSAACLLSVPLRLSRFTGRFFGIKSASLLPVKFSFQTLFSPGLTGLFFTLSIPFLVAFTFPFKPCSIVMWPFCTAVPC